MNDTMIATVNETMIEDINTFPPNVSAALLGEEYDQCLDKIGLKESRKMKELVVFNRFCGFHALLLGVPLLRKRWL